MPLRAAIPTYRARLTSPFLPEEVLLRHPRLRVAVMHYSSPLIDEMISMLGAYPQLHVDIGGIQWAYPREYFYEQLRRLISAGFGNRVMFGSDRMVWPGVIAPTIAIIEQAPFLSEAQKRDIFYHNAARILRLREVRIVSGAARPGVGVLLKLRLARPIISVPEQHPTQHRRAEALVGRGRAGGLVLVRCVGGVSGRGSVGG